MKHDSRKKRTGLVRRLGSGLLAMALSLSLAWPALGQTAYAAGSDRLTISLYDAETGSRIPQGLGRMESRNILYHDVTDFYREIQRERYQPVKPEYINENGVWTGESPINYTPDRNHLYVRDPGNGGTNVYRLAAATELADKNVQKYVHETYLTHWGDDPLDGAPAGHSFSGCRIQLPSGGYRWSANCLENHTGNAKQNKTLQIGSRHSADSVDLVYDGNQLSNNRIYVVTEGSNLRASAYCYEPDVYNNDNGFYAEFSWGDGNPYFVNNTVTAFTMRHETGNNTGNTALDLPRPNNAKNETFKLYNTVMRGGFSFNVRDVETGTTGLQTMGFPETSVFAVFNISDKALSPDSYKDVDNVSGVGRYPEIGNAKTNADKYGLAYVWYKDEHGKSRLSEGVKPYSYDTVMSAYNSYLNASNANYYKSGELGIVDYLQGDDKINYYNGMYGYQSGNFDYTPLTGLDEGNIRSGLFSLNGKKDLSSGIWPVAMVMADANGRVSLDSNALPAGNYLVLQVKAPSGYYLDENFRLAVSIGPWYYNYDIDVTTDPDRWGARGVGFGNALFDQISYTARDSGLLAQQTKGFKVLNDYPAVFVPAGQVTDLSNRYGTANFDFGVDKTAGISSSTPTEPDNQVSYNLSNGALCGMGNDGKYVVNANSVGQRRWPHDGYSRVNAYMAPVRGGVSFRLADGDGILRLKTGDSTGYDFEGQGDAKLDGVTFRLYNDRAPGHGQNGAFAENALGGSATDSRYGANTGFTSYFGIPGSASSNGVVNNKDANWENGSTSYKEYTAFKYGNGEYVLNIPVDELPFGEYTLVQTGSSAGYGDASNNKWAAHIYEELAVAQIRVVGEDTIYIRYGGKDLNEFDVPASKVQAAIDKYTYKGTTYLPQTVYRSDASVSVSTRDDKNDGVSAEIAIYNISEHAIMMNGSEIATAKAYYDAGLSGQAVTNMAAVKQMTSSGSWTNAKIWSGNVAAGTVLTENLKDLPYGTYLIAVTGATGDYAPVGGAAITFQIRPENIQTGAAVVLADRAAIPDIATVLTDASNGTHGVSMVRAGALTDNIKLSNLQNGVNYVVYGILTDKATGQILTGSKIMGTNVGAYQGGGTGSAVPEIELAQLRDIGRMFGSQGTSSNDVFASEDYFTWLTRVDSYVKSLQVETGSDAAGYKSSILDLTGRMMNVATGGASYRNSTYNSQLTAWLNALTGCLSGTDGLTGTASCEFRYEGLDFTKLEGRTAVAYVFVCEGSDVDPKVLSCTTLASARSAMGLSLAAEHASVANLEQTVYFPGLDINVSAKTGGGHKMAATDAVVATVNYKNLEPGVTYRVSGELKDSNGTAITNSKGEALKSEIEFTAENTDGSVVLMFEDLKSGLEGTRLTVHASLNRIETVNNASQAYLLISKGDGASMGWSDKDLNPGKNQIDIVKATVSTVLTDSQGNKSTDLMSGSVRLRDRVSYTDLIPGQRYTSVLTLFYPNGDPVLDRSGREVKATSQFTARKSDDVVNIDVAYDGRSLKDKSVIAFNDLRLGGPDGPIVVSEHDLTAADQTVTDAPSSSRFYFQTSVKDDTTGTRYTQLGSAVAITDSVTIQGLDANESYTLKTEIADAKSGSVLGQIPAVTTQVKAGETGVISQDIKLSINTTGMSGKSLVVYQTLYNHDGTELVVAHADPSDTAQTLYVPGIDTYATAADGVSKSAKAEQIEHTEVNVTANPDGTLRTDQKITYTYEVGIQDRIDYVNLAPGNMYTVETRVVMAEGGTELAKQSTKLSPMDASGSMIVSLTVDVTRALGKSVVVYQTITDDYSGKIVLQHQDSEDPDQTVMILVPGESDGSEDGTGTGSNGQGGTTGAGTDIQDGAVPKGDGAGIQTGVAENYILFLALAGLFLTLTAVGAIYTWKLRRK